MAKTRKKNTHECSEFKNKFTQKMTNSLTQLKGDAYIKSYYKIMGELIQQLHESKKVDFACRNLVFYHLREAFSTQDMGEQISDNELRHYSQTSQYPESQIDSFFNTGRLMEANSISYETLDNYTNKMAAASEKQKQDINNIPKVIHSIWLTNPSSPKEILKNDIKNIIYNKNFFENDGEHWSYIVWTNNKELIPKSAKILKKNGIEVKSINDYKENIQLFENIDELVKSNKFGMASDILRYAIIAEEGGVYADLNYRFLQSIKHHLNKYDFITADFQNNFFASKKHHQILEDSLARIQTISEAIDMKNINWKLTVGVTHTPFVLSIIYNANEGNNVDFYHDYYYAYGLEGDTGPLGQDNYGSAGTWKDL